MKKSIISKALVLCMLLMTASTLCAQDRTIKRIVAIGRFSNETQYGKGLFYDRDNDPMRKQAMDILSAKLAASGKFILLEKEDLDVLMSESADSSLNSIKADYVILGSITQFGRKVEGQQKVFSNTKTQTVEAGVSIRLVEVATRLTIYADEAMGYAETSSKTTLGVGGTAGFDATLSDKAISAAMSQLVENIINKCMDKPWHGYILSKEDDSFVISGGASQGINAGDVFPVYKKGKKVKNPQSGMMVELPGKKIGSMTVIMSVGDVPENEISFCTYEGEALEVEKLDGYYVSDK
jgi:curli biogenesis system outer membrane secretion channel CsgG